MRAELLAGGAIEEGHVTVEELQQRDCRIAVFNSVRGWQEAVFVEARGQAKVAPPEG